MTIQRQYSLPNCTLFLEGLSDATTGNGQSDARPVMSILVNAECHLAGGKPTITGGRDFFESLVKAVSRYAQELLSGVPHPAQDARPIPLVQLRNLDRNLHRLIVHNQGDVAVMPNSGTANLKPATPIEIDLTTVQIFDLVEAVDQFFADSQTLPDLSLQLVPVQRRYAKSDEPVAKRIAPAVLGVSSLTVAAIAFFFVPIPEVQKPKDPLPQPNSSSLSPSPTAAGSAQSTTSDTSETPLSPLPSTSPTTADPTSSFPTASPTAEGLTQTSTPSPTDTPTTDALTSPTPSVTNTPTTDPFATPSASPTDTPTTGSLATPSPSATDTPTPGALISPSASPLSSSAALIPAPEITDPAVIDSLNRKLYEQVDQSWKNRSDLDRELIYRVSVDENGMVLGYKPVNSAAGDAVQKTPLPSLLQTPTTSTDTIQQKPIAEFKVVFTSRGVPQVSPWKSLTETAESAPKILEASQLRQLNRQLYNQIQQNREGELQFPEKLEYRVAVRSDGTVVDYEARNQPAFNYANQTPLPKLKASGSPIAPATGSQESLAYFKVVFTRKGILQVSPWYGYR